MIGYRNLMNVRICICCGERITEPLDEGVQNPNLCGACSRFLDTAEDIGAREAGAGQPDPQAKPTKQQTHNPS